MLVTSKALKPDCYKYWRDNLLAGSPPTSSNLDTLVYFKGLNMAKLNRKKTPQDVKKNLTDETKSKFRVIIGEKLVTFAEKIIRGFTIRDLRR